MKLEEDNSTNSCSLDYPSHTLSLFFSPPNTSSLTYFLFPLSFSSTSFLIFTSQFDF